MRFLRRSPKRIASLIPVLLLIPAAAAFVFIGLKPNDGFLGDTVERDKGGFIVTSATLETSLHEHIHLENNILFPRALAQ